MPAAWRLLTNLGELILLYNAPLYCSLRRPFYSREQLDQCRFILSGNFGPLLRLRQLV